MLQTFSARCIAWSTGNGSFFIDNMTIRQYSQRELVQTVVSSNDVITVVIETVTSTDMSFSKMCNTQKSLKIRYQIARPLRTLHMQRKDSRESVVLPKT